MDRGLAALPVSGNTRTSFRPAGDYGEGMKRTLAAVMVLLALGAAFLGYIGYFGGPVFITVAAQRAPPPARSDLVAVLLSGDMGFRIGMGPKIADRLARDGMPVLGVSSLSYFRTRRTPAEAEALIAEAVKRALAMPGARRVVLIGQSFGADMLQVGLPKLPQALRAKVPLVALVVPGDTISFRASPEELFNLEPADGPALPTARQLDWVPVVCVYGVEEVDSLCPLLHLPNVRSVPLPGGHPLRRDVDRLYAVLADAIGEAAKP